MLPFAEYPRLWDFATEVNGSSPVAQLTGTGPRPAVTVLRRAHFANIALARPGSMLEQLKQCPNSTRVRPHCASPARSEWPRLFGQGLQFAFILCSEVRLRIRFSTGVGMEAGERRDEAGCWEERERAGRRRLGRGKRQPSEQGRERACGHVLTVSMRPLTENLRTPVTVF